jgi:hypothetical protein
MPIPVMNILCGPLSWGKKSLQGGNLMVCFHFTTKFRRTQQNWTTDTEKFLEEGPRKTRKARTKGRGEVHRKHRKHGRKNEESPRKTRKARTKNGEGPRKTWKAWTKNEEGPRKTRKARTKNGEGPRKTSKAWTKERGKFTENTESTDKERGRATENMESMDERTGKVHGKHGKHGQREKDVGCCNQKTAAGPRRRKHGKLGKGFLEER